MMIGLVALVFLSCVIGTSQLTDYKPIDLVNSDAPIVNTEYGKVRGVNLENANAFFGIPYADPPTGKYRWKPARQRTSWSPNILNATEDPAACPQSCFLPPHTCPNKTSEDCLSLTVFSPLTSTPASKFPVLVFFHGGNFRQGSGYSLLQDGRYIANKTNTIVVFVNYRLGALGFLVAGDGPDAAHGNYGILDQRFALEWIRDNIANFGGNPGKVTISGQSAGAQSVAIHLTSPKSDNLFHQAIMESNPFTLPFRTKSDSINQAKYFAEDLGCKAGDVDCMRAKPAEEVVDAQQNSSTKIVNVFRLLELFEPWGPYVDGIEIAQQSVDAFRQNAFQKKPILVGTTSDEARANLFVAIPKPMDKLQYYEYTVAIMLQHSLRVLLKYPPAKSGDQREELSEMGHPYLFVCPNRVVHRAVAAQKVPIWTYVFDHALSFDGWGPNFTFCDHHACHGSELPFVFHSVNLAGLHYSDAEKVLADSMVTYWGNFVHTGNPNSQGWEQNETNKGIKSLLDWPTYDEASARYMNFSTPQNKIGSQYMGKDCDFWDSLHAYP
ncbi:cAMP-regulated D2 protein-like [Ptychodera flava]|uniref:cAMP-regulated D2 protein-like n=1 Tax=Ptychodera flava TaxID=63121 RepID=UPI00396A69D5